MSNIAEVYLERQSVANWTNTTRRESLLTCKDYLEIGGRLFSRTGGVRALFELKNGGAGVWQD